ncbi:unnamed protein product [Caenorhabditis nigoni]
MLSATSTIKCSKDGTYSHLTTTAITKLTCDFGNCGPPCEKCDVDSLLQTSVDPGTSSYPLIVSGTNECLRVVGVCERSDPCTRFDVMGITAGQPNVITETGSSTLGTATLECTNDGTFKSKNAAFETFTGITEIQCSCAV